MRTRSSICVAGALVLALSAVACEKDDLVDVRGSGRVITESREVSGFDEVVLRGFGEVIVEITGSESLTIEAEDNIMPLLTSEVVSGRLELGAEQNAFQRLSPTRDVVFRITATELVGTSVLGSGNVTVAGAEADSFSVSIAGSGNVTVTGVETVSFSVSISGSGNVTPVGTSDSLRADISGSGNFDGEELIVRTGSVSVAGSGNAVVNATDELEVSVSGSGNVEYIGSPSLQQSISGSGEVKPH